MSQKKILVIDDEDFIRDLVKDFLELGGIVCQESQDLPSAISRLKNTNFDMVLLDRNLGNYKADDIVKEIRDIKSNIPIIILTGDHLCDEKYLQDIGANGIIYKPFQVDEFLNKINFYLESP